ncbi:TPA: hypothetical protein IVZ00_002324 [Enterococcus faecium]|nr:hypothetical protein [Enterococcus faecium]
MSRRKGAGLARNNRYTAKSRPYPNEPYSSDVEEISYYEHYRRQLTLLTFQLFEWENLPKSIDPRYLEIALHTNGYLGFFKDSTLGFMVCAGAEDGQIDHYHNPIFFTANEAMYHKRYPVLRYDDDDDKSKCIMLYNNDLKVPTLPSLHRFALDMADINQISRVNRRAQKTPVIIQTDEKKYFSLLQAYNQIDENNQAVFVDKDMEFDESFNVWQTNAPYVVDKLRSELNEVWNEVLTFLGINNANVDKTARVQTSEVLSNNEQIESSGNILLKSRKEFCDRVNRVFGDELEGKIDVKFRTDAVRQLQLAAGQSKKDQMSGGLPSAT